ncbi:MAG: PAS domain-containing protein [Hyphomicrobiaceae bacterium]|nr:PAS domain-containing protein [Hyphomicrobiaceae bacterium]
MFNLTGVEKVLPPDDIIVSKTNLKGHIEYANNTFLDIADFSLGDVLNEPHSILRNENMPRCVFQLLWEYLQAGREIFAYVVNNTKNGDHYWVFAHVTPSFNAEGEIVSYHSNRRAPSRDAIEKVKALYDLLLKEEAAHPNRKDGQKAGYALLQSILAEKGVSYDEFVLSL